MSVGGAEGPTQITLQGKGVKKNQCCRRESYGGSGDFEKKNTYFEKNFTEGEKNCKEISENSLFLFSVDILPFHQSKYFLQYSFLQTDLAIERLFETPHTIWGDLGRPRDSTPPQNKALFTFWVVPARGGQIWTLSSVGFLLYKKPISALFSPTRPP